MNSKNKDESKAVIVAIAIVDKEDVKETGLDTIAKVDTTYAINMDANQIAKAQELRKDDPHVDFRKTEEELLSEVILNEEMVASIMNKEDSK